MLRIRAGLDEPTTPEIRNPASPPFEQELALIIPTLYEAGNIAGLLGRVRTVLDSICADYEILIVDDDSRDGTAEIVHAISAQDPRIRLLVRKGQRGLSGAVLHGWENTDAQIVGVMDADFQHPPELLPQLAAAVFAGYDLAVGSRYIADGQLGRWSPLRKMASAVAVCLAWPIQRLGLRATDPMSGYFLVRRECLRGIPFQQSGFKLLLDILVRARISSVREIPFTFGQRRRGASKANVRVAIEYCRLLARLYRQRFGFRRVIPVSALD